MRNLQSDKLTSYQWPGSLFIGSDVYDYNYMGTCTHCKGVCIPSTDGNTSGHCGMGCIVGVIAS